MSKEFGQKKRKRINEESEKIKDKSYQQNVESDNPQTNSLTNLRQNF